jgi:hypothetical protein
MDPVDVSGRALELIREEKLARDLGEAERGLAEARDELRSAVARRDDAATADAATRAAWLEVRVRDLGGRADVPPSEVP